MSLSYLGRVMPSLQRYEQYLSYAMHMVTLGEPALVEVEILG